jgi:simple sugar transport system ATP-binding protein
MASANPVIEMKGISKRFGGVRALQNIDFTVGDAEILGLVGDNGAGKSTLIKVLMGVYPPDEGEIYLNGRRVNFSSASQARAAGIEAVYQDLALVEQLSMARNFFLGKEPTKSFGPIKFLDLHKMSEISKKGLTDLGIVVRSTDEEVAVLSGGERQSISIGRAMHFGAKLLILDEPTSALSIKEAEQVLAFIRTIKQRGLSAIFITHNLYHVFPVADRFTVLFRGTKVGDFRKEEISIEQLTRAIIIGVPPGQA